MYRAQVSLGGKLASRLRVDIVSVKYLLNVRTSGAALIILCGRADRRVGLGGRVGGMCSY